MTSSVSNQPTPTVERIHLIFKTHLDVGFTDFAANVVSNYFNHYIPKAIELAEELRQSGSQDRFVWTTGSWLIYEYLEQADAAGRKRMENAIANGDIAWHALPFTTHSENMDVPLFRFGLSLSKELDQRFGKHTIAAKMTDVPGHTRGIVPLLAEAGVKFLHIGVNGASTPPDVPPVFVWRDPPSGAEVLVMYHKGSYGDLMLVPGLTDGIAFAHTGDNLGPQSPEELHTSYQALRERFPGAAICAATMDAFAERLETVRASLPVVEQEIGDTWIHGAATDPKKEARYRELLRLRQDLLSSGTPEADLHAFSRKLLMIPEHTWGLDLKTHLNDWRNYTAQDFQSARGQANYQKMEASWQEQRDYLRAALDALPSALQAQANERLASLEARAVDTAAYQPLKNLDQPLELGPFTVAIDPQSGTLTRLEKDGIDWAGPDNRLGQFWYETFSAADYQRFHRKYNINKRETSFWSIPDFTKPGLEIAAPEHKAFQPKLVWAGVQAVNDKEVNGNRLLLLLEMPEESVTRYGAPRRLSLELWAEQSSRTAIHFDLQWFDKPASRLPEAAWFSFTPRVRDPRRWRMEKLGEWISPYEVIRNGNRHLHAVWGVRAEGPVKTIQIQPLDSALVAPGQPSLLDFNNRQPDLRQGLHFNLHNNLWGTNFPMWYDEDARLRFLLIID